MLFDFYPVEAQENTQESAQIAIIEQTVVLQISEAEST